VANRLEQSDINPKTFFTSASRYVDSPVVYYSDLKRLTLETYKRQPIGTTATDKFMIIGKGYEYRPDLVSVKAYGLPDFWWRIMEANGISDIYQFKAGVNIRIPSLL
jgi:hypothetical protein